MVKKLAEPATEVAFGGARATLVGWRHSDLYVEVASDVTRATGLSVERMLFLENLRQEGGSSGDGARLVYKAVREARATGRVLVAVAVSRRLSAWYEQMMDKVPTAASESDRDVFSSPRLKVKAPRRGSRQNDQTR